MNQRWWNTHCIFNGSCLRVIYDNRHQGVKDESPVLSLLWDHYVAIASLKIWEMGHCQLGEDRPQDDDGSTAD